MKSALVQMLAWGSTRWELFSGTQAAEHGCVATCQAGAAAVLARRQSNMFTYAAAAAGTSVWFGHHWWLHLCLSLPCPQVDRPSSLRVGQYYDLW